MQKLLYNFSYKLNNFTLEDKILGSIVLVLIFTIFIIMFVYILFLAFETIKRVKTHKHLKNTEIKTQSISNCTCSEQEIAVIFECIDIISKENKSNFSIQKIYIKKTSEVVWQKDCI